MVQVAPAHPSGWLTDRSQHRLAPHGVDQLRHPVAGHEGRIAPLDDGHPGPPWDPGRGGPGLGQSRVDGGDDLLGPVVDPEDDAQPPNVGRQPGEGRRAEDDQLTAGGHGRPGRGVVDGAHGADILNDHHVGQERGQAVGVDGVEGITLADRGRHGCVDLARAGSTLAGHGHVGSGHDGPAVRGGIVALVGNGHQPGPTAQLDHEVRGARHQGGHAAGRGHQMARPASAQYSSFRSRL